MSLPRNRIVRLTLAAFGLIGCALLTTGCIPQSRESFTVANQLTNSSWTTGTTPISTGTIEPNPSTGAGSYREIDEKNGVKYP
jgi:hypothetical protein